MAQLAKDIEAELIVVGPQRKRPLVTLLGTTAERVIALADRPVLIVNSEGTLSYDNIVGATDLRPAFVDLMRVADR
jgi:hypothetical protein